MNQDLNARLNFTLEALEEVTPIILGYYESQDLGVEHKSDGSEVTKADREAEERIRTLIEKKFPQDGVLGEEYGEKKGTNSYRWILDPIDGTHSFVNRVPLFGTLVGLEREGEAVLGVIGMPALGEILYGIESQGSFWKNRQSESWVSARVSQTRDLSQAKLCYTSLQGFRAAGKIETLYRIQETVQSDRGWGDCFAHVLVATGRADLALDPIMNIWDCAALKPVVEQAGGKFFDWKGNARIDGGSAVSTNGLLSDQVQILLKNSK